ncbi:MAG TPA: LacI family DNA-binding transcriptional regulator [Phototrophicaceae bacterium]|nr:LacI family DNA-binding transcriptional regulator [Phototrophicaceae bacterium]
MRDVASAAGVSIATVSRVVNGNYPVSDEAQARVLQAMEELQYHPNAVARGLRRQRSQSIGVLIPKLNDSHLGTFSYIVEKALFAHHYRTLLCNTEETLERETEYVESLLQQRVDGVILFPREHSRENVERLLNANVEVVMVERRLPDLPVHHILVTNYDGGYTGMRHLIDLGHRNIALFTAYTERYPIRERIQGALDALRDAGIEQRAEHFLTINTDESRFEIGYRQTMALLRQKVRPTAIFAMIDEIAIGALQALSANGVRVPDEISLIGFDNIALSAVVFPPLTTVAQPTVQMAETAGAILMRRLEGGSPDVEQFMLNTRLVVRDSTAPPQR